jgi:NTE family protein
MAASTRTSAEPPDALVLGGGGILGEAWMNAVLAGLHESGGFDARDCSAFIGTSAGSIVATGLAAGVHPRTRLGHLAEEPAAAQTDRAGPPAALSLALEALAAVGTTAAAPLASLAMRSTETAGALLRRLMLAGIPAGSRSLAELGRAVEDLAVRWDGRLLIAAVDLHSGRRVVFGAAGAPPARVSEAVQASCAIPGVFQPVVVGARSYVDGGVWSPTNMDAARVPHGGRVLCLNPTGSLRAALGAPAGAVGAVSRSIAAAEALVLKRRGVRVRTVNPDEASRRAMGINLLDSAPRAEVTAAGMQQGRRLASALRRRTAQRS